MIFLLANLSSCALIVENYQKSTVKWKTQAPTDPLYCAAPHELNLLGGDEQLQKDFLGFLKGQRRLGKIFKFGDLVILWSLAQMNERPAQSSPYAQLQLAIHSQNQTSYFDFSSKAERALPSYILGLLQIEKLYPTRFSVLQLARLIDKKFQHVPEVDEELATFLEENTSELLKLKSEIYVRGEEVLRKGETLKNNQLAPLVAKFIKRPAFNPKHLKNQNVLFPYSSKETAQYWCNYDLALYENSLFLVNDKKIDTHFFGLSAGDQFFMASSSLILNRPLALAGTTSFFQGNSWGRPAAFCYRKSAQGPLLWLFADKERDPGQHLFHLTKYQLSNMNKAEDLEALNRFSRHLFLTSPLRLLFEASRTHEEQIQKLLKLNFPLYHSKRLGRIWGYFRFQNEQSFLVDDRWAAELSCLTPSEEAK